MLSMQLNELSFRWLPRSDIKVLVDDGYPFLFKNAVEIEIKMRAFLQVGFLRYCLYALLSSVDCM